MGYPAVYGPVYTGPVVLPPPVPPVSQGLAVPSRLTWLGIAREILPGSAALPVAAVPVGLDGYEPEDTPQFLLDQGVRASMGSVAGAVPGVFGAAHAFGGPFYPDSGGWWLDGLLGDTSAVSGGTLGTAQPLAAALGAGSTQLAVGVSLGAVTTGSVIQISDGTASEVVIASPASTGTAVNFAGTPCRFPHTTAATAALQTAASTYSYTFATLNSGTGQPPSHTLTDTTGLTAGTGARAYPGAVVTQIDLAGDPGKGWVTAKVSGIGRPSQPSAATVAYPVTTPVPAFAGWQSVVTVNGTLAYAGPWAVSMKRPVVIYRSAQNPLGPQNIPLGGLEVTGALGYPDPSDETPLANMLTGGLMPVQVSLSNGLTGASALSMTITSSAAQFTRAKHDREAHQAVGYLTTWQATDNGNDTGGSGGIGPATVSLVNGIANY
jgi:hypothetical protein